jgi:hypothetical protein
MNKAGTRLRKGAKKMTKFKRFRIWMIMAAVFLAIVATPLLGVMLSRTNLDGNASPGAHAQAAFEKGSDASLSGPNYVSHPHPQHRGPKYHWTDKPLVYKADGDAHSAVVARWHRDSLRNLSRQ